MVTANLIGFGMGSKGFLLIVKKLINMTSPLYFIKIMKFLIPSASTMFYIREYESQVYGSKSVKF